LLFLHIAERDDWHHLVTRDEWWFFLNTSPCRMWILSRDDLVEKPRLNFQSKIHFCNHVEPEWLLCCRHTLKWYQNEQRLFCDKYTHSICINNLSSSKGATSETTCDPSQQLLISEKSSFNRLARRMWYALHVTPTLFAWFGTCDFYLFPTMKEKLEQIHVADEYQFSECLQ
jgi:hypothetical protein